MRNNYNLKRMRFAVPLPAVLQNKRFTNQSLLLFLLVSFSLSFATGDVYGNCGSGETITWSENQTIAGTFVLDPDDVLVILPGVTVEFQTVNSGLQILGTIQAEGTAENPVIFEGTGGSSWSGIDLSNACPSTFEYCHFTGINRSAARDLQMRNSGGFNISMTDSVSFNNCLFEANFDAIEITDSQSISFTNSTFQSNELSFSDNGLIYLLGASDVLIKENYFYQNKVSLKGILNVNDGSNVTILDNTFSNTTFSGALFFGSSYPIVLARAINFNTQVAINGNAFLNNRAPSNQKLAEVQLTGNDNNIDLLTGLIWNNNFVGYLFPIPGATPKSAVRVNSAVVTISHNTIRFYNDFGVRVLKSEAKINLNTFENNRSNLGALSFDNYSNYAGRPVSNVVFANAFINNKAPRGAAINCSNIPGNLVTTIIDQNIFSTNQADELGGAIYAGNVSNLLIQDNTFSRNAAIDGGGVFIENSGDINFIRNLFYENTANAGSGLYLNASETKVFNCNFVANQTEADGGALFLDVNAQDGITIQNCNFADHGNAGGIAISNAISPEGIEIYNTLFYGNNSGTTGKAIVFTAAQDVVTSNCYFDILPTSYSVQNIDPQQATWPGWLDAGNFYLDCENSVCVDNGNPDVVFDDRQGNEPDQALFPSCGTLTNDIGISGGPYAANKQWLFQISTTRSNHLSENRLFKNEDVFATAHNQSIAKFHADDVQIYPNPSSGRISISTGLQFRGELLITLINQQGLKIFENSLIVESAHEISFFDFSNYPKGTYLLLLQNQNQSITKKIILN